MKVFIPPLKCQGIKSKLVPRIKKYVNWNNNGKWIEPFVGSGVVGFNIRPKSALFCDNNPHIIKFYNSINNGDITPVIAKEFLETESSKLSKGGKDYYYEVRDRFNQEHNVLDFLFLNRSCFNGIIRFNRKGCFNVPFGHKPERFMKAYITKIVNQIEYVYRLSLVCELKFKCQNFEKTFLEVNDNDFIYCDPPYAGRHVDYYNSWTHQDEIELYKLLKSCSVKFILSTWYGNQHRNNPYINSIWSNFKIITINHYYHVGAKETNRKPMKEALVLNYEPEFSNTDKIVSEQVSLELH